MTDKKRELSPEELKKASGGAGFHVDPQTDPNKRDPQALDEDMSADELKRVRGGVGSGAHNLAPDKSDATKIRNKDQAKPGATRP